MKKIIIAILTLIMTLGLFASCAGGEPTTYTITFHSEGGSPINPITFKPGDTINLPTPERDGKIFAGWYNNPNFAGNSYTVLNNATKGDKEFWAKWTDLTEYTITYRDGNNIMSAQQGWSTKYNVNDANDTPLPIPSKNGYNFAGWYDNPEFSGEPHTSVPAGSTGNKTFYVKWEAIEYTITFATNVQGYTIDPLTYTIAAMKQLPQPQQRDYYTFDGWYLEPDFSGYSYTSVARGSTGNKVFYAKWIPDEFPITYVLNGGSFMDNDGHPEYYTVEGITLVYPVKEGYSFGGWYDNADLEGSGIDAIPAGQTGPKTLYAKWLDIENAITYTLNNGQFIGYYPQGYTTADGVTLVNPTRLGYRFDGWYEDAEFTGEPVTEILPGTTGNKHFYAKWSLAQYLIHFELNGGSFNDPAGGDFYVTMVSPSVNLNDNKYRPSRIGYDFEGWYSNSDFAGSAVTTLPSGITSDRTFYAKWKIKEYLVYFKVGNGFADIVIKYNIETSVPLPQTPSHYGFNFIGWYNDQNLSEENTIGVPVGSTGEKIIYSKWEPKTFNLTFNPNGGTMPEGYENNNGVYTGTYTYNNKNLVELFPRLPIPVRTGYVFGGWYEENKSTSDINSVYGGYLPIDTHGDKTFYALWLNGMLSTENTQRMEAEHTDLTGKSGPGGSGSQSEGGMVSVEFDYASNGQSIPWTRGAGVSIDWCFKLDRNVTGASVKICFGSEIGNVVFNNSTTAIYINGQLYTNSWSVAVSDREFATFTLSNINLHAGYNIITIEVLTNDLATGFEAGGPVFDYIELTARANIGWTPIIWVEN